LATSRKGTPGLQIAFGGRIRELREALGLTREQLAATADLSPQNVAKIEAGERFVTADSLERLSSALKVSVGDLFQQRQSPGKRGAARRKLDLLIEGLDETNAALIHDVAARILRELR
jgi:transcriptional regulator with XRE-family HTH domain